jgi:hypothetical protein
MAIATKTRSDVQIQSDVLAELKWDARVKPNEIGVSVRDGVVTLTGVVDSYPKRWAAEDAAHRVRGVKAVANDIEVRLAISSERNDADIAAAAVRSLEWDAFVSVDKLDITVSKGWVAQRRGRVAISEEGRRTRHPPFVGCERRRKPHHGQASCDALRDQDKNRGRAVAKRATRCEANYG